MHPTVLIVDDNEDILRTTAEYFRARGFTVVESATPLGVTALINRHKPSILILDLMMPTLDGDALLRLLRKSTSGGKLPTVFYSSADEERLYRLSKSIEGASYVQKSDGLDALFQVVESQLANQPE